MLGDLRHSGRKRQWTARGTQHGNCLAKHGHHCPRLIQYRNDSDNVGLIVGPVIALSAMLCVLAHRSPLVPPHPTR
ncbi:hypothetical protein J6590_030433 [Homalodisca vitripennis]|nr:hypothetical protein J6590_030433 [Homalodisca vitripennis]